LPEGVSLPTSVPLESAIDDDFVVPIVANTDPLPNQQSITQAGPKPLDKDMKTCSEDTPCDECSGESREVRAWDVMLLAYPHSLPCVNYQETAMAILTARRVWCASNDLGIGRIFKFQVALVQVWLGLTTVSNHKFLRFLFHITSLMEL
jgi:hypothetical protein